MALRSKDFVGLAENIKCDELSTKGKIESLENKKVELSNTKSNIFENIAYIDAQIMAAFEDTDEDGNPNYSRIAMLQAQKHLEEIELQSVENDIENNNADIEQTKDKLENVLDEKEQTLFEIQERARKSLQNIKTAGGMYGAYAGVGQAVQNSMQTSLSALSKAASILGGTVDTSGASSGSNLQFDGGKVQTTVGLNKTSPTGNLLGVTGGNTSQGVFSENYISEQQVNSVSGFAPNYHSGQKSINPEEEKNYSSKQEGMYIINAFNIADGNDNQENEGTVSNFISEQSSSINILDTTSSDDIMDPKQQLAAYMNAHNYGKADYLIYSQDPEWQRLHQMAYPEKYTESALKGTEWAKQQLAAYMNTHNYQIVDYPIYSRDPEWKRLHQMAYPEKRIGDHTIYDRNVRENSNLNGDVSKEHNFNTLLSRVHYLDKIYSSAEVALAFEASKKDDWDVVRGRLASEYRSISDLLKDMAEQKQKEYNKLREEYFKLSLTKENGVYNKKIEELSEEGRTLSRAIENINSSMRYADMLSDELAKNLVSEKRTVYIGVANNNFTDIHKNMIQQQGKAVVDFKGTCGDCSIANTINVLGGNTSEAEVVQRARELGACTDKTIPVFLPESLKEKMRGSNGGTSVIGRTTILNSFGYNCDNKVNQSLSEISQQLEHGKGAIINVDHRVLNKQVDVSTLNPFGTDHALTITGIEKDQAGNPVGLWIHDTGVCSNMGNAFYCNAQDYEIWRNTPRCTVQYIYK